MKLLARCLTQIAWYTVGGCHPLPAASSGPDRRRPIGGNKDTLLLDPMLSQIPKEKRPRLGRFGLHNGKCGWKNVVVFILHNGHQKHSAVSPKLVGSIHRHKRLAMFDALNARWKAPKNLSNWQLS
ncbi:hypothetical protein PIB30_060159 [Stylosanthes scabra]|uniref:Uncharacterized protein n=1 Tax=Stylosanthes scabra TaxID=79078 RepID=A0ABU6VIV7_9FABA|nr:hypothetical protein [Stylosanthes scabra]